LAVDPTKPRVIKDYEKLPEEIQEQIKLVYPEGFSDHLIRFTNKDGKRVSALPFETDEKYYLVRMTVQEAKALVREDEDYDEEGSLKTEIKEAYHDKYADLDHVADYLADDSEEDYY